MELPDDSKPAQHLKDLLFQMILIRQFERKAAEMFTKMKIRGFLHLCIGEEAIPVGVMNSLSPEDNILCTYREHGHALARGIEPEKLMAEMYGKVEGCSRGRGGSMHLFDIKRKFYGGSAIVAGHLPLAVGLALADKKLNKKNITCCFFGEGAMAEGEFHESMNLSALLKVPVLFICENNLYAMGTALKYSHAVTDLEKKGIPYGIQTKSIDGMDVLKVEQETKNAICTIQETGKPFFLICNTYRYCAHSMFDAQLYRTKEEVEEWKKRDPINNLSLILIKENKITEEEKIQLEKKAELKIQEAISFAEKGSLEPIEDLDRYLYH